MPLSLFQHVRQSFQSIGNKTIKKVHGKCLIEILLFRLSKSKEIDKIIVATPKAEGKSELVKVVKSLGYEVFQGDEINVLDRYYQCAKKLLK